MSGYSLVSLNKILQQFSYAKYEEIILFGIFLFMIFLITPLARRSTPDFYIFTQTSLEVNRDGQFYSDLTAFI